MKVKSRKWLIREADRVFSEHVRKESVKLYKVCPFCLKNPIVDCFHFVTRAKYSVRWNPLNAVGSCRGCNIRMEFDPHPFIQWFLDNRGGREAYDALILESNQTGKFKDKDKLWGVINTFTKN